MNIEESIRKIVTEELDKRQSQGDIVPLEEFCRTKGISRVTVWRAERSGKLKLTRIGTKVFVNKSQFSIS
jgi:hypothetical protein